jgi:hypothetical protein
MIDSPGGIKWLYHSNKWYWRELQPGAKILDPRIISKPQSKGVSYV